jgi:hypothetical protein
MYEHSRLHPRPPYYRTPSWSWASVDGAATVYEEEDIQGTFHFKVNCWTVDLIEPAFPYGAVRGAILEAESLLNAFILQPSSDSTMDRCDGFLAVRDENNEYPEQFVGEAPLDTLEPDLVPGETVDCLAVSLVDRIPRWLEVEGLRLLRIIESVPLENSSGP